ncbi:MAG TPA: efflux transporter outer membrane subunit [Paraburkholderia sp.]|jgi:NodT family efflux transporter outer membrane factor (OMF) lipoprotein
MIMKNLVDMPACLSACLSTSGLRRGCVLTMLLLAGCAVGPDYHKPSVAIPTTFKEGVDWQRAATDPQAALTGKWWLAYRDDELTGLVQHALDANQSIAGAQAAYRLAEATVAADRASLFPTITAGISGSRSRTGTNSTTLESGGVNTVSNGTPDIRNFASATATADWEPDLWGQVRREIESGKANAQAADATLAGERLSIVATVATDYFEVRQLDIDISLLKQQQAIDSRILDITRDAYAQGTASSDNVLEAQDTLQLVVADLQSSQTSREQFEHAIAVLTGVPPASFSIKPRLDYVFSTPAVPPTLPSELLERRPDVVSAERMAEAANARIGVAKAAFFPILDLSAEGGFQHNTLAHLFTLPSRVWTLGPDLAATLFDGGARTAAVHEAQATYDESVAAYREAVLTAFQNVEDSLSSLNHLQQQEEAFAAVYARNQQLFVSERAQLSAGTASEENVLTQQLTLLLAQQNLSDTQGALVQSSVGLVKNLGGGWKWGKPTAK